MAATNVQAFSGDLDIAGAITSNLEVGTANLFVDTVTGNVGIGLTTPKVDLHIYGGATDSVAYLGEGESTDKTSIVKYSQGDGNGTGVLQFGHFGDSFGVSPKTLCIKKGGNIGIGTTNPLNSLHLATTGDFYISNTSDKDTANERIGRLYFYNGTNLAGAAIESCVNATGANNNADLRFFTSLDNNNRNIERMRIVRNGNVGIGVGDPRSALTVYNSSGIHITPTYTVNYTQTSQLDFNTGGGIGAGTLSSVRLKCLAVNRDGGAGPNYDYGAQGKLIFQGKTNNLFSGSASHQTYTDIMTVDGSTHCVGIGVTNPSVRLAVNGSLSFTSPWISSSSITITQYNSNTFFNCIPTNTVGGYTGYKLQIRFDPSPGNPPYAACAYVDWFSIGTNSNGPQYNTFPMLTSAHAPNGLDQTMVVSGTMGLGVTNSGLRLRTYSNYYTGTFTTRWYVIGTNV